MAQKQQKIATESGFLSELAGRLRLAATRPNILGYIPHEKQVIFHSSGSKSKLFIGGNRSGKTVGGATEAIWWLTGTHPYRTDLPKGPIRGRCVSVDFTNGVEKIVGPEIARWAPPSALRGGSWKSAWDKETRTLYFENGSFLEFMSYDQDLDKFAGTSRHFIWFDEEPPNDIFNECMMRLIDTGGSYWVTMTPVEGMTWVFDDLYEPGRSGLSDTLVVEVEMGMNPHLNMGEMDRILAGLSADERKAREKGQFVQIGGTIYKMWNPDLHILGGELTIPTGWLHVASMDHGFNNPTAWLWAAVSPDGDIIVYDEHYEDGKLVGYHAAKVHETNLRHGLIPSYYVGDPSIRNTDPITGTSVHLEYLEYGIPIVLGNNDVKAGINRVGRYLTGLNGKPKLYVHERCRNLLHEIPRYRWSTWATKKQQFQKNKKEEPHKKNDHACDALRYLIASRPEVDDGTSIPELRIPAGVSIPQTGYDRVDTDLTKPSGRGYVDDILGSEW